MSTYFLTRAQMCRPSGYGGYGSEALAIKEPAGPLARLKLSIMVGSPRWSQLCNRPSIVAFGLPRALQQHCIATIVSPGMLWAPAADARPGILLPPACSNRKLSEHRKLTAVWSEHCCCRWGAQHQSLDAAALTWHLSPEP